MDHADGAPSVAADAVPSEAKYASGTGSTLLTNLPSAAAAPNWTAKSTPTPKSGFGGVNRSGSR